MVFYNLKHWIEKKKKRNGRHIERHDNLLCRHFQELFEPIKKVTTTTHIHKNQVNNNNRGKIQQQESFELSNTKKS